MRPILTGLFVAATLTPSFFGVLGCGIVTLPITEEAREYVREKSCQTTRPQESPATLDPVAAMPDPLKLPPLPEGVSQLRFSEFFVHPVGDRGLQLTEKLSNLNGKRVRILGYMVREEDPPPGRFLLAPIPAQVHDHDNGLAEDLPASVVHVFLPTQLDEQVLYTPGLMLFTGTLGVGNREEVDGRISVVRLALDSPELPSRKISSPVGMETGPLARNPESERKLPP